MEAFYRQKGEGKGSFWQTVDCFKQVYLPSGESGGEGVYQADYLPNPDWVIPD